MFLSLKPDYMMDPFDSKRIMGNNHLHVSDWLVKMSIYNDLI